MKRKVLIIKLGAIGDIIMATPSFKAIRDKHKNAHLSLLVGEWSMPIVKTNPNIDQIICIDETIFWEKRLFSLMKLYLRLFSERFDMVYIMHWSRLFALFSYLLRIPERIGFDRDNRNRYLTKKIPFKEGVKEKHMIERYLSLVNEGYKIKDYLPTLYLADKELHEAWHILGKKGIRQGQTIVGIAPGGGQNPHRKLNKRWPKESFLELIIKIHKEMSLPVVLFGDKVDKDASEYILKHLNDKSLLINLTDSINLRIAAALMSFCRIVVANDSAPLHLAAAAGVSTLSIFGPTPPYDKVPLFGRHSYLYKNLPCSPCYKYGYVPHCETLECLTSITVEEAFNKLKELL